MDNEELLNAIAALSAQISALQTDMSFVKAAIAARQSGGDVFEKRPMVRYVTIKREGESLWYECDAKDKDVHIPVPGDRLTGVIQSLTVVTGEYEGDPTRKVQLSILCGKDRVVLCLNAKLDPKSSVPLKMFLDNLTSVPDVSAPITFQVYAGAKALTVGLRLINPVTGKGFVDATALTDEDKAQSKTNWRDRNHFEKLLAIAIERIEGKPTAQAQSTPQKSASAKPKPTSPAPDLVLTPPPNGERSLNAVDAYRGMLSRAQDADQVLKAWEWVNGPNQQAAIAEIPGIVRDTARWRDEALRRVSSAHTPVDVGDAIAGISVEMQRLGMGKKEGSARLLQRYGVGTRAELTEQQVVDFWQYLRGLQPVEAGEW